MSDCTCAGTAPGYPQHEPWCGKPERSEWRVTLRMIPSGQERTLTVWGNTEGDAIATASDRLLLSSTDHDYTVVSVQ